ncbi:hypothetical protein [Actinomadura sp. 6N118]|uniref:hypothetical protein n=1 Tax=Actinomadura sp. 6N118 TaxID=3375151 RepID=UPI003794AA3E
MQIRQAMVTWLRGIEADPAIELSWIRAVPRLGTDGIRVQRELLERFVVLIRALTDTADLRAAGVKPASRHTAILLLGGLNELVAVTLEDGSDIYDITETAIDCTLAILGPRACHPARSRCPSVQDAEQVIDCSLLLLWVLDVEPLLWRQLRDNTLPSNCLRSSSVIFRGAIFVPS